MLPEGIGVSTITLARTPHEEKQIVDSLKILSKLNLPIVVCDGNSPVNFLDQLKKSRGRNYHSTTQRQLNKPNQREFKYSYRGLSLCFLYRIE